jgi:hypothetical protein
MEMDLPKNLGLVKLPPHIEIAVYLIKAELKNRKFTKSLELIGFDSSLGFLDLCPLILKLIGYESRTDATFEVYYNLLESYIEHMDVREKEEDLNQLALSFYMELEKKKQQLGKQV